MATIYDDTWLHPTDRWVKFTLETPLGGLVPAERCFRAWVEELERHQVQLAPRWSGQARQLQLLRGTLQTAEGRFSVELCYTREVSLGV